MTIQEEKKRGGKDLHDGPAEEADTDHHDPAGNDRESVHDVAHGHVQAVLGELAVKRVQKAFVGLFLLPCLCAMDLVDGLGGDGGVVQVNNVQRHWWARLARVHLGKLEVPDRRRSSSPNRAQDRLLLAIQVGQVGRSRVGGKQRDGFLDKSLARQFSIRTSKNKNKKQKNIRSRRSQAGRIDQDRSCSRRST